MSIDEAIAKYNKLANNDRTCYQEEAYQLAEWLEELKVYHQHEVICNKGYNAGYNKAIDDFSKRLIEELSHTTLVKDGYYLANIIKPLAEQLKAGVNK